MADLSTYQYYLICKWSKCANQKIVIGGVNKKKIIQHILFEKSLLQIQLHRYTESKKNGKVI